MDKQAAIARAKALGLRIIRDEDEVAGVTCRVIVRRGAAVLEIHTKLEESQSVIRAAKREARAGLLLGVEQTMGSPPVWDRLTAAQQAEIDKHICGFVYIKE